VGMGLAPLLSERITSGSGLHYSRTVLARRAGLPRGELGGSSRPAIERERMAPATPGPADAPGPG